MAVQPDLQIQQASEESARKALTEAFFSLTNHWGLTRNEEARLLGWKYEQKRAKLDAMRKGDSVVDDDEDKLGRMIDLINIHKSLRVLFPEVAQRPLVYDWVRVKRERFGNYSALDIMLSEGRNGISAIRRYLDHERTR